MDLAFLTPEYPTRLHVHSTQFSPVITGFSENH